MRVCGQMLPSILQSIQTSSLNKRHQISSVFQSAKSYLLASPRTPRFQPQHFVVLLLQRSILSSLPATLLASTSPPAEAVLLLLTGRKLKQPLFSLPAAHSFEHLAFKLSGPTALVTAVIYRPPPSQIPSYVQFHL